MSILRASQPPPEFSVGQLVEVIVDARKLTFRRGAVRCVIWHYKDQRWNFYLEERGKKVSRRYIATELRSAETSQPTRHNLSPRGDVFTIDHFLSPAECADWIARNESAGFEEAAISTVFGQVIAKEVRNNDRRIFDDPALAAIWFERARALLPTDFGKWQLCGFNERFRAYRYHSGQQFAPHRDGSFERHARENSWLTFMVYLNEGFSGGATRFDLASLPELLQVIPRTGMALVFMHDRRHCGEPVIAGTKYVLRTDVMYRRVD